MKHFLTLLLCLVASLTAGAVPTTPTFSTEDGEATWYYIRFKSNYNCYLTDCGVGNNVQVMALALLAPTTSNGKWSAKAPPVSLW